MNTDYRKERTTVTVHHEKWPEHDHHYDSMANARGDWDVFSYDHCRDACYATPWGCYPGLTYSTFTPLILVATLIDNHERG